MCSSHPLSVIYIADLAPLATHQNFLMCLPKALHVWYEPRLQDTCGRSGSHRYSTAATGLGIRDGKFTAVTC